MTNNVVLWTNLKAGFTGKKAAVAPEGCAFIKKHVSGLGFYEAVKGFYLWHFFRVVISLSNNSKKNFSYSSKSPSLG